MAFDSLSALVLALLSSQPTAATVVDNGAPGAASTLPRPVGDGGTAASEPVASGSDASASMAPPTSSALEAAPMQQMGKGGPKMGDMGLMPLGVMIGEAGKWMVGYSYTYERMVGNLIDSRSISDADVLRQFAATPTDMTMQMHMGSLMYAPTDRLTLMAMVPYQVMVMDHVNRAGERFQEKPSGFGDIDLSGSYSLYASPDLRHRLLLNMGVSLPRGSINKRMMGMRLEYPMQLGSGTVALLPGFTYLGQARPWGWGAGFGSTLQLGRNSNKYTVGNRYEASVWVTRLVTSSVSVSAGLNGEWRGNVRGFDPVLDPLDEPTKDALRQGGERVDAKLGVAFHPRRGVLNGNSFFLNADLPVLQSLDGPQLKKRFGVELAIQREF